MIQRLQTLFLALAVIANLLMFNFDIWSAQATNEDGKVVEQIVINALELTYNPSLEGKATRTESRIWLTTLVSLVSLIGIVTIFLYKNRPTQLKISRFGMLLEAGLLVLIFYLVDSVEADYFVNEVSTSNYGVGIFLPMIGVVCFFLANIFIMKDERLVRSSERLR